MLPPVRSAWSVQATRTRRRAGRWACQPAARGYHARSPIGCHERAPIVFGLAQPVEHGHGDGRVDAHADVRSPHLDVLGELADLVDAGLPRRHPVGPGVDRRRRHRQRRALLFEDARTDVAVVEMADLIPQAGRTTTVIVHHPVRTAERDHLAHQFGVLAGERPSEDTTEALADQADRATVMRVEILQAIVHARHDLAGRADVATETPGVGPVSLRSERGSEERERVVTGREAGQQQHRVVVAPADHPQPRTHRPEPGGLQWKPRRLHHLQVPRRRTNGSAVSGVGHRGSPYAATPSHRDRKPGRVDHPVASASTRFRPDRDIGVPPSLVAMSPSATPR